MTTQSSASLTGEDIARSIGILRQLKQQIEAVRQDFTVSDGRGPELPPEVTQFHFRREMVSLARQIRQALGLAFGEHSPQGRQFDGGEFVRGTSQSFTHGLLIVDRFIFELEQKRLHRLDAHPSLPSSGIDSTTDLYTEPMLGRYLEHEVAWSQRQGDSFGLLLLRLPTWPSLKQGDDEGSSANELLISMACVVKTRLRGYDFPCRLKDAEFAVLLRQANALVVNEVARRITTDLEAAARRLLPLTDVPIEFTSAVYPYDAENIEALFAYAAKHWTRAM